LAIVAIIPARYASTRLPGKPLSDIHGKPMIQHVHEQVRRARRVDQVLVATDDQRIAAVVERFGGEVVMTSPTHPTGTDRLAEAVRSTDASVVVNVQGDEPMLDPAWIDAALAPVVEDSGVSMSTLSLPLVDADEMLSPAVVKVVSDRAGDAMYFSRSPIPHVRLDATASARDRVVAAVKRGLARQHVGLYVYTRETLLRLAGLAPVPLEEAEGLEQLRALHHGIRIRVVPVEASAGVAVDTPADLERARALMDPRRAG
jgi:3-deoxy-manno-octulosonate cytidylyltransferase (CMP-KDO synthetase)